MKQITNEKYMNRNNVVIVKKLTGLNLLGGDIYMSKSNDQHRILVLPNIEVKNWKQNVKRMYNVNIIDGKI